MNEPDTNLVATELGRRLLQRMTAPRSGAAVRGYVEGPVDFDEQLTNAIRDVCQCLPDEEADDAVEEWSVRMEQDPVSLLTFSWFMGDAPIALLDLPGGMTFVIVPYRDELPCLALGALPTPVSSPVLGQVIDRLIETNWDLLSELPDRITNQRPDLVTLDMVRALIDRIDDEDWRLQAPGLGLKSQPTTREEFVDAYLQNSYEIAE